MVNYSTILDMVTFMTCFPISILCYISHLVFLLSYWFSLLTGIKIWNTGGVAFGDNSNSILQGSVTHRRESSLKKTFFCPSYLKAFWCFKKRSFARAKRKALWSCKKKTYCPSPGQLKVIWCHKSSLFCFGQGSLMFCYPSFIKY